jgi:hypothetical protein
VIGLIMKLVSCVTGEESGRVTLCAGTSPSLTNQGGAGAQQATRLQLEGSWKRRRLCAGPVSR